MIELVRILVRNKNSSTKFAELVKTFLIHYFFSPDLQKALPQLPARVRVCSPLPSR